MGNPMNEKNEKKKANEVPSESDFFEVLDGLMMNWWEVDDEFHKDPRNILWYPSETSWGKFMLNW